MEKGFREENHPGGMLLSKKGMQRSCMARKHCGKSVFHLLPSMFKFTAVCLYMYVCIDTSFCPCLHAVESKATWMDGTWLMASPSAAATPAPRGPASSTRSPTTRLTTATTTRQRSSTSGAVAAGKPSYTTTAAWWAPWVPSSSSSGFSR